MKPLFSVLAISFMLVMLFTACGQKADNTTATESTQPSQTEAVNEDPMKIPPAQFAEGMIKEGVLLVDIRKPDEYMAGRLQGAQLMDYYDDGFMERFSKICSERTVYFYCRSGGRSGETLQQLQAQGITTARELKGGILAWEEAKMPVVQ